MPSLSPWRLAHPGLLKELHCIHICSACPQQHARQLSVLYRVRTYYGTIAPQPLPSRLPRSGSQKDLKPNKMLVLSKGSLKAYGIRQTLSALGGTEAEGLWTEH